MLIQHIAITNCPFRLHLVIYLDVGNFCDKSTETTLHEICVKVFLRFSYSSKPSQSVSYIYELAWFAGICKSEKNLLKIHVRLLLRSKLLTYFDDVTTIESNRKVRVNVDAKLVAIFRIVPLYGQSVCVCIDNKNLKYS